MLLKLQNCGLLFYFLFGRAVSQPFFFYVQSLLWQPSYSETWLYLINTQNSAWLKQMFPHYVGILFGAVMYEQLRLYEVLVQFWGRGIFDNPLFYTLVCIFKKWYLLCRAYLLSSSWQPSLPADFLLSGGIKAYSTCTRTSNSTSAVDFVSSSINDT